MKMISMDILVDLSCNVSDASFFYDMYVLMFFNSKRRCFSIIDDVITGAGGTLTLEM